MSEQHIPPSAQLITVRATASDGYDAPAILRELRQARRRQRLAAIDWFDAAYHVYLAGLIGIVLVLFVSSAVGDQVLSAKDLGNIDAHGAAAIGLLAAAVVAVALRSGSRGGPLAMEAAEVRHVLLAPVDRAAALRAAAWRQLRYAAFIGVIIGAAAGQLAGKRFHENAFEWIATGAATGVSLGVTMVGTALVASGRRLNRPIATLAALAILIWGGADLANGVWSPLRAYGALALWPRSFDALGLLAIAVPVVLGVVGVSGIGGLSLEAAERRTGLVGQLRFAVTVQDLRTVMVLRRQLAQDQPRDRPWIPTRKATKRFVVARRDVRSLLRFPAGRLGRIVLLSAIAGLALNATWNGTTPLIIVGAGALYLVALDIVEPLAQQVDQVDRTEQIPIDQGELLQRHLVVPAIAMLVVGGIAYAAAMALQRDSTAFGLAALFILPAAWAALAGAVSSVVSGAPTPPSPDGALLPPEVAGIRIALRAAWPVLVSIIGCLPIVVTSKAVVHHHDAYGTATNIIAFTLVPVAVTASWVRYRVPARLWWRKLMEEGQQAQRDRQKATIGAR